MKALVWLRRDLRLLDNPALSAAVASGLPLEAAFVYPDDPGSPLAEGTAARCYLHHSLQGLQRRLADLGIALYLLRGEPAQVLPELCRLHSVTQLYWNRLTDPDIEQIDHNLQGLLEANGVVCTRLNDDCLVMPELGLKKDGTPYRVFTPFWRNEQDVIDINQLSRRLIIEPRPVSHKIAPDEASLNALKLLPAHSWPSKLLEYWQPGEPFSLNRLDDFIQSKLKDYDSLRDYPALDGTSGLSAAFHFGELSVTRAYIEARQTLNHETRDAVRSSVRRFLSEIGWREFGRHVLHAFPDTPTHSMNRRFDRPEAWEPDPDDHKLERWQRGRTGIALVDAGMRELWASGRMHNRVRMVAASFLTKNLGIHWRVGASWFADTLVDADRASNTLAWQWVAGCGTDAAPYHRIFNPDTQASKFDPEGLYIKQWWNSGKSIKPVTDLRASRKRALERYGLIRNHDHA